jgi:transketolase
MVVISPCDAIEAKKATLACAKTKQPTYLRLARENTPLMTTEDTPFEIGKANVMWKGETPTIAVIATGALVHRALLAAKSLAEKNISITVVNVSTIKPLDETTILAETKDVRGVVSVEEHQVAGGLGGALAELFARTKPTPMRFIGVQNKYGQSGTQAELIKHYGMDEAAIAAAVEELCR